MKNSNACFLLLTLFLAFTGSALAEVAVIAHPACVAESASTDEIRKLYLGKSKKLAGASAVPVDQSKESQVSSRFYELVVGKSAPQVRAYWSKLVFTGKGRPPRQVGGDSEVVSAVASDPNLIGYVDAAAVDGSVKVLLTIQ